MKYSQSKWVILSGQRPDVYTLGNKILTIYHTKWIGKAIASMDEEELIPYERIDGVTIKYSFWGMFFGYRHIDLLIDNETTKLKCVTNYKQFVNDLKTILNK